MYCRSKNRINKVKLNFIFFVAVIFNDVINKYIDIFRYINVVLLKLFFLSVFYNLFEVVYIMYEKGWIYRDFYCNLFFVM